MARKSKKKEKPTCECGSGKPYEYCCGSPARIRAKQNQRRLLVVVFAAIGIGLLLAFTRSDAPPPEQRQPARTDQAPAAAETAPQSNTPPAWYYDSEKNQHWDPEHGHWHEGPPPEGKRAATPPPWSYNPLTNQHWHPEHNHWHDGPPPPEGERDGAGAHEGHAH